MSEAEKLMEECQRIFAEIRCLRDALVDMIKNHEENLSDIAGKIDQILQHKELPSENDRRIAIIDCRKWSEFREVSAGASLVAYEMDVWNVFSITSARREFIYRYSEKLPISQKNKTPKDSVCRKVLNLDPPSLRRWLSKELKVPEANIVRGNLVALSQYMHEHEGNTRRNNTILEYYNDI